MGLWRRGTQGCRPAWPTKTKMEIRARGVASQAISPDSCRRHGGQERGGWAHLWDITRKAAKKTSRTHEKAIRNRTWGLAVPKVLLAQIKPHSVTENFCSFLGGLVSPTFRLTVVTNLGVGAATGLCSSTTIADHWRYKRICTQCSPCSQLLFPACQCGDGDRRAHLQLQETEIPFTRMTGQGQKKKFEPLNQ